MEWRRWIAVVAVLVTASSPGIVRADPKPGSQIRVAQADPAMLGATPPPPTAAAIAPSAVPPPPPAPVVAPSAAPTPAPAPAPAPKVLAPRPRSVVTQPARPVAAPPAVEPPPMAADDFAPPPAMPTPLEVAVDADADAEAAAGDDSIVLNFENADIREVIYSLAVAMNINYWVDPRVQGQVTVRTSGKLARADLVPIFHQLLRNNGFAAVKTGDLYSIVPAEEGKTKIVQPGRALAAENHFVMNVIKVRHVSADQMSQTVTPFVSPGGDVLAFPRSNLVIVTDIAQNADRLGELVRTFDTNTFAEMNAKIFKIEHAVLEDIADELQSVLEAYHVAETGSPAVILPLQRLGAIAVIAHDSALVMAVDYWVSVLDVEAEEGGRRQVYVYRVENSKSVDLAGVLSEVYGEGGGSSSGSRRGRSGEAAEAGLGLGGGLANSRGGSGSGSGSGSSASLGNNRRNSRSGGSDGGSLSSGGGSSGGGLGGSSSRSGTSSSRGGRSSRGGGGGGVILGGADGPNEIFEQEVRVVEDEGTNSLVILSTPRDYQTLRTVLKQLDVVPRQVLIESMIAEISLNEGESFSIVNALNGSNSDTGGKTGDQGGAYFDMFGRELRAIGSLGAGGLFGAVSHFRNGIEVYRGVINAAANNGKAKVLSRPNLMTSDNQEARILIGQEVPIITSTADTNVQTNGQTQFLQNIQYRDTGLIIRVLPQVNSEGLVNLQLAIEVSEIAPGQSADGIQSPTFTTREAETTVVVNSGETIIIGGIIFETVNQDEEGVPYLMNVPVLGRLFRSDSTTRRRTELIILITPFVVRDRDEARSVTEEFRRRVDRVLEDVELTDNRDPAGHTLILEAATGDGGPPPPPASTRPPVKQPDGGPIPLDFNQGRR